MRRKLIKAQATMKLYADKRIIPHPFKIGDTVFVKLKPFCQTSVVGQRKRKLSKCCYGPFQIKKAFGEVAFELELPVGSKIHAL